MNTVKVECGLGLQKILIDILKPITFRKENGSTKYMAKMEFVGTVDNPIDTIKAYGKGIFESLEILEVE